MPERSVIAAIMVAMTDFSPFNVKDEFKTLEVEDIKSHQQNISIPYSIAMYNVIKDFNLASVVRNVCAFGLKSIYIVGNRHWDRRGAVGAQHYVEIIHVKDFNELLEIFGEDHLIGLELPEHYPAQQDEFIPLNKFRWKENSCILLGEENSGIPEDHLSKLKNKVYINQPGVMRSLNAATASGIAMYDMLVKWSDYGYV